jgi:guanylate kinase
MSLFFITGVSATGKSSITHELRNRGNIAYDTDDDALARWQNNETGYIHPKSSVKPHDRTEEFLKNHSWNVPREFIEKIADENPDANVFVCGVANNMDQIRDLFSDVFALLIDEETLRHRIATRTNNDWGKQSHELQQTLDLHKNAAETYGKLGYTMIDGSQSLGKVVDEILDKVNS